MAKEKTKVKTIRVTFSDAKFKELTKQAEEYDVKLNQCVKRLCLERLNELKVVRNHHKS